jgi:hypothetical protein
VQAVYGKGDGAVAPLLHSRARAAHERLRKLKLGSMDRILLGTSTRGLAKVRSPWRLCTQSKIFLRAATRLPAQVLVPYLVVCRVSYSRNAQNAGTGAEREQPTSEGAAACLQGWGAAYDLYASEAGRATRRRGTGR